MPIENDFPFLTEKGHIVSFVGGGGKTTLMYAMAAHCARKNWRVMVTTTTHIMQPSGAVWAQTDAELFRLWEHGSYAVAGTAAPGGKMTTPPQKQLEHWMQLADIVLIEADGSRQMPCKAPAAHEPVLLPQCDIVLAVAGVSALGESLEKGCFRAELAQQILRVPGNAVLTPTLLAKLLASESGGKKAVGERSFYAVLNQVDTEEQAVLARQTADILKKRYSVPCILTHFEKGCFRAELAQQILRVPGNAVLTPTLLAKLLASESGGKKAVGERSFYAVLNQVDTEEQAVLARQTADILKKRYSVPCILTHFEKGERA